MTNDTVKFYTWAHKEHYDYKSPAIIYHTLYSNIDELFKNLPNLEFPNDNIVIHEAIGVIFSEMKKSEEGLIIEDGQYCFGDIIPLSKLSNPLPVGAPIPLIITHVNALEGKNQNDILLAYAINENYYHTIRYKAIKMLPFSAFDTDTLIDLLSDTKNSVRDALATKLSTTEFFPDWVYKILMNDKSTSIAFAANMRLSEKHSQDS